MSYILYETDVFEKSILTLQKKDAQFVREKLTQYVYPQLKQEPHFGANIKKLKNYQPVTWRYKIGSYRVFYTIDEDDEVVIFLIVKDRSKAYKK